MPATWFGSHMINARAGVMLDAEESARVVELASRIPPRLKMKVMDEKYLLKRAGHDLIPAFLRRRPKQPYRAPETLSFFDPKQGRARFDYVEALLAPERIRKAGLFSERPVARLVEKGKQGKLTGIKDAMALVSILSAQLVHEQFIESFGRMPHGTVG